MSKHLIRRHHHYKKLRIKKRVVYLLLTTLIGLGIAVLITAETTNVYAVSVKIILYVIVAALLLLVVSLSFCSLFIRRKH
jgi:heme A synthase